MKSAGQQASASAPEVSVVMSVFNAAGALPLTVESVLQQEDCELEFIVVDDGSVDGSGDILDGYAERDSRMRVIHQPNGGLTKALIRGCAEARGTFIARQDANDISMPGRLKEQSSFLRSRPDVVAVASTVRFLAPAGEWLFDVTPQEQVKADLDSGDLCLPPLVAACLRRDAYLRVGGFRPTFRVAQDVDLWLRLLEVGTCSGLNRVHYQATLTASGISSRYRIEQLHLASLAMKCANARRLGQDDAELLAGYRPIAASRMSASARENAAFHYFIGSCLRHKDHAAAQRYFRLALRDNPFHLKSLVRRVFS